MSDVGTTLRQARERLGHNLQDVSRHLHIGLHYLEAIENGDFGRLPGRTYAIGFVRSYANFLRLDADRAVELLKSEIETLVAPNRLVFPSPAPEGKVPGGAIMLIATVLIVVTYAGWYYLNSSGRGVADLVPDVPQSLQSWLSTDEGAAPAAEPPPAPSLVPPAEDPLPPADSAEQPATTPEPAQINAAISTAEPPQDAAPAVATPTAPASDAALPESAPPDAPATALATADSEARQPDAIPAAEPETVAIRTEPAAGSAAQPDSPPPATISEAPATEPAVAAPTTSSGTDIVATGPEPEPGPSQESAPAETQIAAAAAETADQPSLAANAPNPPAAPADPASDTSDAGDTAQPVPATAATTRSESPAFSADRAETVAADSQAPESLDDTVLPDSQAPGATDPPTAPGALDQDTPARIATEPAGPVRVVIRASDDSWVRVRAADSTTLMARIMHAGETYEVPNRRGLRMTTGNAGALTIVVNGQASGRLGEPGEVIRNIDLDPAQLLLRNN